MRRLDYKWVMLALVSSAYFLAQGTRQIYNSVLPQIKSDFLACGVTDTQLGIVGSAFALAFGIAIPFAGLTADFLRRKWMIVAGMAIRSLLPDVRVWSSLGMFSRKRTIRPNVPSRATTLIAARFIGPDGRWHIASGRHRFLFVR